MAKGQMRSNKEKKKPKQDKNKKHKGGAAPSPFAAGQGPGQPGANPYGGKKGQEHCGGEVKFQLAVWHPDPQQADE